MGDSGDSAYRRILLKLSGEALMGDEPYGISNAVLDFVTGEIKPAVEAGVEIALVIGAGNIFRGVSGVSKGMQRTTADNMGMLATVINCLALHDALEKKGIPARVLSAISMPDVCESYSRQKADHHLRKNRVVIFAAGTGNPLFTTDTAAVLRALEINADIIFKATRVDGVYDRDPLADPTAVRYDLLTYAEALQKRLRVMDSTAFSLAQDNRIAIKVFNMNVPGNIARAVNGEAIGTLIRGKDDE